MYNKKFFIIRQELEQLYVTNNMSRKDIANKYGVHEDTVYYWLKKYKIRIKKVGRPKLSKLISID